MNEFDQFRLPLGITKGVEIPLRGTSAKFTVILPSSNNEDFTLGLLARMNVMTDSDSLTENGTAEFLKVRKKLFFDTCIVSAEGIPAGMDIEEFFDEYPLASKAIYSRALELCTVADAEVQEAMGNLNDSPSGEVSGAVKKSSTTRSKKAASRSKPESLN